MLVWNGGGEDVCVYLCVCVAGLLLMTSCPQGVQRAGNATALDIAHWHRLHFYGLPAL